MIVAPSKFQQHGQSSTQALDAGNEGIVPSGFVNVQSIPSVVQGIDLSQYQDEADFTSVKKCGGTFAYVRLSAGTKKDNELFYVPIGRTLGPPALFQALITISL